MKVKVCEASGPVLDWMVAKALWGGVNISTFGPLFGKGFKAPCIQGRALRFKPSTNWAQGGPIIEREDIALLPHGDGTYEAEVFLNPVRCTGPTPLIAAMRCYVASKMGEEVDVPQELV